MYLPASSRFVLAFILLDTLEETLSEANDQSYYGSRPKICGTCVNRTSSYIFEKCHHVSGRCCLDERNITIGLDLGNCSLKSMRNLGSVMNISWLNLNANPELDCNGVHFTDHFKSLRKLHNVTLPKHCRHCPGGNNLWKVHHNEKTATECEGQLDSCKVLNVTCPQNSKCQNDGPGFFDCFCDEGWVGYKCMRKNGIPLLIILCSIAGGTLLVTFTLWIALRQRQKRYPQGYTSVQ